MSGFIPFGAMNVPFSFGAVNVPFGGTANMQDLLVIQQQLAKRMRQCSRSWTKVEADLASELVEKIAGARSPPDVLFAWQEWNTRRMQSMAEEVQKFVEESRDFATQTMHLMSNPARAHLD